MDEGIMIQTMDPMLIKIYEIKDIEEICLSDFAPSSQGSKINVLPNLYVRYDGGKYLSLCSQDKYFDVLVRKVFQVYNLEKDRVMIDPDFDPFGSRTKLKIDDRTKQILESGDLTNINEIYSFYDGKKSYHNNLLFQSDELKMMLPMIKYHLKQIFDCTDRVITLEDDYINGYRNNYSINYKIDGIDDTLIISFVRHNNNETALYIRSRDMRFKPLEMFIKFEDTSIEVDGIAWKAPVVALITFMTTALVMTRAKGFFKIIPFLITIKGTLLVVCVVQGEPSSLIITSQLP